ncbi:MAG: antitoxin family protein [Pirellulales bacterium]
MSHMIPAVFNARTFRPLEPVELAEGTPAVVQVESAQPAVSDEINEDTRKAWCDYLDRMERLPDNSPKDGLTNRDHDRIIYEAV